MADAPIETVTVDTGADPESIRRLNDSFADFWKETDDKDKEAAPPAPEPAPAKETAKALEKPVGIEVQLDSKPEVETSPAKTAPEPSKEIPEADIEKMELPSDATHESRQHFKRIKELWISDKKRLAEEQHRAKELEIQLSQARENLLTPELKADYEHAVQIRRKFDVSSDPEFVNRYDRPIEKQFHAILEEAVQALPDRQEAIKWAEDIKNRYGPDKPAHERLTRDWWLNSVVNRVSNDLERDSLLSSVKDLLRLQRDRGQELARLSENQEAYHNFKQENDKQAQIQLEGQIKAEIAAQEARIKEVLPVDVSQAKTTEERKAMEEHNQRFKDINERFMSSMTDLTRNGPRAWVRASIELTRTHMMEEKISSLQKDLNDTRSERDQLKKDLEKISSARRKISNTYGTHSSADTKKNGQGMSIKELSDPRKSMAAYWEEIDKNQ
jgi:hypothetical protein